MTRKMNLSACAMVALAGSSMSAHAIDWAAVADGNWNDAINWVGSDVPNVVGDDAVLGLSGAYTVDVTNNFTHGALTISNPDVTLAMGSIFHTLNGDLLNNGTVLINKDGVVFNSHIAFGADAMIAGGGEIVLNGVGTPNDAQVISNAGFTVTHASGHTIRGAGLLAGTMVNDGNIIGDSIAGGLELQGTLTQGAGGNAGADGGTLQLGNGSVTTGGEFVTANGGIIEVSGNTATIGNLTNSGDLHIPGSGRFLDLNAGVLNNGTITINPGVNVFNAHLRFTTDATLDGNGDVHMFSAGDLNDAQVLVDTAVTGTIGSNQTVHGSGVLNATNGGSIVNMGTVNGDDASVGLGLAGNHVGTSGVYRSDNGTVLLRNGLILDGGTFETSGSGSITKDQNGTATIGNIANNGQMNILGSGSSIALSGTLVNNGTLTMNSDIQVFNAHLRTSTNVAIGGTGTIQMNTAGDIGDAQILTDDAVMLTFGENLTVAGAGLIDGKFGGVIENLGVINGNYAAVGKTPIRELRLLGNHTGNGLGVYRSDDGLLGLGGGLMLDSGTFDSSGVGIVEVVDNATATVSDVTNLGEMGIRGGGSFLSLTGPMINNGTLTINSNMNVFNAHLTFDSATAAINGTGTVRMQTQGDIGDAQMYTSGMFNGTIGSGQTVAGAGQIDGRADGTIVNNGVIDGDDPVHELRLRGNHDGSGGGVYRSTGGVLGLSSGLVMNGGTFETASGGSVSMTTNGVAQISNMTNIGTMDLRGDGGIVDLLGPLTNNGTININSNMNNFNAHIRFEADTEIDGTGTIVMSTLNQNNDAQIIATSGFVGTIGAGQTVMGDGLLVNTIHMNGVLDPDGPTRAMNIDDLTFSGTSGMIADLGGLLAGEFDRVVLNGGDTINLDGTLTVQLDDGYVPMFLDTWDIIDGGTVNGEFADHIFPPSPAGLEYKVIYESGRVFVVLTCAADLTGEGDLNFLDVSTFLGFYGAGDVRGDINGDGNFNFLDVSLFLQIFSGTCGGA
jgi:hypothetical protein